MSVNKYKPHIHILPEDEKDEKLANGFLLAPGLNERLFDVLRPAGGWRKVLEDFAAIHAVEMSKYQFRYMVLLIDFDEQDDRYEEAQKAIPSELKDRVFILGVRSEPENLQKLLKHASCEKIGEMLADGCPIKISDIWNHELLKHNLEELNRIPADLKVTLFSES